MKKNILLRTTNLLVFGLLLSLNTFAQGTLIEGEEVIVYSNCHPMSDYYDPCFCDGIDCPDSGDCTDVFSSAYPCIDEDSGDCTDPSSTAYPCEDDECDPSSSSYLGDCDCLGIGCGGDTNSTPIIDSFASYPTEEILLGLSIKIRTIQIAENHVKAAPVTLHVANLPSADLSAITNTYNATANSENPPVSANNIKAENTQNLNTGTNLSEATIEFNNWLAMNMLLNLRAKYDNVEFDQTCNSSLSCYCNSTCEENNDFDGFAQQDPFFQNNPDDPWRLKQFLSPDSYYVSGLLAGLGDGVIETANLVYDLGEYVIKNTPPVLMYRIITDFDGYIQEELDKIETAKALYDIIYDPVKQQQIMTKIQAEMSNWFDQVTFDKTLAEAGYQHGKILFEVLGALVGVAEVKALLKFGQFSATALSAIRKVDGVIQKGFKFAKVDGVTSLVDDTGRVFFELVDDIKKFKYSGFGGDIATTPNKTTTIIGKWDDVIDSGGTKEIIENGLSKSGENVGGINALSFDGNGMTVDQQWVINQQWLDDAIARDDIIRSISNAFDNENLYRKDPLGNFINSNGDIIPESNLLDEGIRTFYGKEVEYLQNAGYIYNATDALWFRP